jgi:hypothetical protein
LRFSKHVENRCIFGMCLFFAGISLLGVCPADLSAAQLDFYSAPGNVFIKITGEIVQGDARRFTAFVEKAKSNGAPVMGIVLNSPGGSLAEGFQIALTARAEGLATWVHKRAVCASACFIVFAGGVKREVNATSRIGVHGVSNSDGTETTGAATATVVTARALKAFGVPDAQ